MTAREQKVIQQFTRSIDAAEEQVKRIRQVEQKALSHLQDQRNEYITFLQRIRLGLSSRVVYGMGTPIGGGMGTRKHWTCIIARIPSRDDATVSGSVGTAAYWSSTPGDGIVEHGIDPIDPRSSQPTSGLYQPKAQALLESWKASTGQDPLAIGPLTDTKYVSPQWNYCNDTAWVSYDEKVSDRIEDAYLQAILSSSSKWGIPLLDLTRPGGEPMYIRIDQAPDLVRIGSQWYPSAIQTRVDSSGKILYDDRGLPRQRMVVRYSK